MAATALKCMGGELQGRLVPMNEQETARVLEMGCELGKVLYLNDLVKGDDVFFASTGISDGDFLRGYTVLRKWYCTDSFHRNAG